MSELGLLGKAFGPTIDLAKKLLADNLSKKEARRAAVHYWGMILFELHRNVANARAMTIPGNDRQYGIFSVKTWESLFDVLAKLSPMPRLFATVDDINSQFREISLLLRAAVDAGEETVSAGSLGTYSTRGGRHQWDDAHTQVSDLLPRALRVFNDVRSLVDGLGREAFGDRDWQVLESEILPGQIES